MTAKVARLRACWRVDLKMSFSFSRNLRTQVGELDTWGAGRGGHLRPGPEEKDHAVEMEYKLSTLRYSHFDPAFGTPSCVLTREHEGHEFWHHRRRHYERL